MDFKSVFQQVKGFSIGLLVTPAALADQFILPNKKPYCDRLTDAIAQIPDTQQAGKAGMVASGIGAFVGVLAIFNHVTSGPRLETGGVADKAKVEIHASQRFAEGKIHQVRAGGAEVVPSRSPTR